MKANVGENLKRFRNVSNYTQEDIAKYLEISRGAYANYESNEREMPYELILKICDLYGISLSLLFEENIELIENELVCAFRISTPDINDVKEISSFKSIVRNYLKMNSLYVQK